MQKSEVSVIAGYRSVKLNQKDSERFWSRVDKTTPEGCWTWTGYYWKSGYGLFHVNGSPFRAHRVAFEDSGSVLDEEKPQVNHKCHNRKCCNPAHLYAGTQEQNRGDMLRAGRQSKGERHSASKLPTAAKGSRNGNSRFNAEEVLEIRRKYAEGRTQTQLLREYGCSQCAIYSIVHRLTWTHI